MGYIYRITNLINGKVYIGQTKQADPEKRWALHKQSLRKETGGCPLLKAAMLKYGVANFKFEVLIICFDTDLHKIEKEYIKKYNAITPGGYNILPGGQSGGGFKGKKHSSETIQKIKNTLKGLYIADPKLRTIQAERAKINNAGKDLSRIISQSDNFKKAVAEGRVGRKGWKVTHSVEEKVEINKRISETLKTYYKNNSGSVVNIDKHRKAMAKAVGLRVSSFDGTTLIKTYDSISEAARNMVVNSNAIKRALKNPDGFTCKGLSWRYTPLSKDA